MAYFPNGDAFDFYAAKFCERCIHRPDPDGKDCPIIALHWLWNYDAVGDNPDETKRLALNMLWPRAKDGIGNQDCQMFVERE